MEREGAAVMCDERLYMIIFIHQHIGRHYVNINMKMVSKYDKNDHLQVCLTMYSFSHVSLYKCRYNN